jgi:hypothetical protein
MAGDDLIVNTTWQDLKSKATSKGLSVQFVETSTAYEVFAIDAPIVYQTVIFKGAVPDASFSQIQNDSDKSDFETNYKNLSPVAIESEDTSGRRIIVGASADGASVSGNPVLIGMSDGSAVRNLRGSNSAPVGTEYAVITRNIPSGTQTVSGIVTANAGTGNFTVAQSTASNLNATVIGNVASGSALSGNPVRIAGSDGTNVRNILTNTSGHVIIAGSGTAGSSATGVVTIQGIASGTPVPISGSITATNPSVGTTGNATPTSSTLIGASDGTNLQALRTSTTTPTGTEQGLITRNIPSGTQAISGTVTANAGTGTFAISAASLPLPAGAATETTLSTRLADSTFTGRINTLGQKTSANSTPVVLASDQSAIAVSGTIISNQGTSNTLSNAWASKITDGYGLFSAAVKSPSVAPLNTDPALVVAISPNSNLSVTSSGTYKPLYGTGGQAITITLNSLANNAARASSVIDNNTLLFEDIYIFIKIRTGTSGTSTSGYLNVYGYGTVDGTNYPDNVTGTDSIITLTNPPNLPIIAQINTVANSTIYTYGPFSFCRLYGLDRLPQKWGIVIVNKSGATLDTTAGNFSVTYQGINGRLE